MRLSPVAFESFDVTRPFWLHVTVQIFSVTCFTRDEEAMLDRLCRDELVLRRMELISSAAISYHRVTGDYVSRLEDWQDLVGQSYPPLEGRPKIKTFDLVALAARQADKSREELIPREPSGDSHRDMGVRSVIDLHAWNQARWRGAAFAENAPSYPPYLALMFGDEAAARSIFQRWFERLGAYDKNDLIRISIVRKLPGHSEHHYILQITANVGPEEFGDPFSDVQRKGNAAQKQTNIHLVF